MEAEPQEVEGSSERVVLARRTPDMFVGFQWTGAEPDGMDEPEIAEGLGAVWEGDELVVYHMKAFEHAYMHNRDGYQNDPD